MSGEPLVRLEGPAAERLVDALAHLEGFDFALVGGFAVMARLGRVHRATQDLDGVFDNPSAEPTTVRLVSAGVATEDPAIQRVKVAGTFLDVIDTAPLPADPAGLPDDPGGRLFVCAHRHGYESATPMRLTAATTEVSTRVASAPGLLAMKAHALRFARRARRASKRPSDLVDLYRLAQLDGDSVAAALSRNPWGIGSQVRDALIEDVAADYEANIALLRRSGLAEVGAIDPDDFIAVIGELIETLGGVHRW